MEIISFASSTPLDLDMLREPYNFYCLYAWNGAPRVEGSGRRALPILITSAPIVAKNLVAVGPAIIQLRSIIRIPDRGRSFILIRGFQ